MRKTTIAILLNFLFFGSNYAQDYDSLINLSREQFYNDRTDSARFFLTKAISIDPRNPEPYVLRAFMWESDGDNFSAIRELDTAIQISSQEAQIYLDRALLRNAVGDRHGALKDVDRCLGLDAELSGAWQVKSDVFLYQNRVNEALEYINTAIGLDPTNGEYYSSRAYIYVEYLEKPDEGFKDYSTAFQILQPKKIRPLELLIDAAMKAELYDSAIFYDRIVIKRTTNYYPPLWSMGKCFKEMGKKDSAIYYLTKAIELNPVKGMFYMRSTIYFNQKNFRAAIRDLDSAISIDSNYKNAYLQRAKVKLEGLKDVYGALEDYDKLIATNYDFGEGYYYRALLFLNYLNDPQRACVDIQKAILFDYKVPEEEMERVCDSAGLIK